MAGVGADGIRTRLSQLGEEPNQIDEFSPGHQVGQALGHERSAGFLVFDRRDRNDAGLPSGLLEHDPLLVLVGDDALEDLAFDRDDASGCDTAP